MSANDRQVAGNHYNKLGEIQPWDMWIPWNLNGFQCEVLKLVVRYKDKNGIQDIEKAIHYLEKLIEIEKERSRRSLSVDASIGIETKYLHYHIGQGKLACGGFTVNVLNSTDDWKIVNCPNCLSTRNPKEYE